VGVSWVFRPRVRDQRLLAHEQGHYHISYVVLLQLLQTLGTFTFLPRDLPPVSARPAQWQRNAVGDAILTRFEPIRRTAVRCLSQIDGRYDKDTNHGGNTGPQAMWRRMLAAGVQGRFDPMIHFGTYYPGASRLP
jgi:hypothetical protein